MEECIQELRKIGYRCTITTTLRSFSSCSDEETASTEYDCEGDDFKQYFDVKFYANGSCSKNEGYVSIIFHSNFKQHSFNYYPTNFSCVASVIDGSGKKRFSKTSASDPNYDTMGIGSLLNGGFGFEKFVKRSTLLSDSFELLPGDSLTLCLEIEYEFMTVELKKPKNGALEQDGDFRYLRMESGFGQDLCKMSDVFQCMMNTPMVESETGQVSIRPEEESSFNFLFKILYVDIFTITTIEEIRNLYILADKYNMQQIIQTCHQLLISMMRVINTQKILDYVEEGIHMISELAERFTDDISLREILTIYSDTKCKLEGGARDLVASNVNYLESEWNCEYLYDAIFESYHIQFSKIKSSDLQTDVFK